MDVRVIEPARYDRTVAAGLIERMAGWIRQRGRVVVALPFGATPRPLYRFWREKHPGFEWDRVVFVSGDEYAGRGRDHPDSGARYFDEHLLPLTAHGLRRDQVHWLDGAAPPAQALEDHRAFIAGHGGIDLMILGLGPGPAWRFYAPWRRLLRFPALQPAILGLLSRRHSVHLWFNEAGTPFDAGARQAALHRGTRRAHPGAPAAALTLGLAEVRAARSVVVLAKGAAKRSAVDLMLNGPVTPLVPATVLRLPEVEPRTTAYIDTEAEPK